MTDLSAFISGQMPDTAPETIHSSAAGGGDAYQPDGPQASDARCLHRWRATTPGKGRLSLGIEFTGRVLSLVGLRGRGNERTLDRVTVLEWPDRPTHDSLVHALKEFEPSARVHVHVVVAAARAMVRYFHIPPVPKKKRLAAACWEGQKLLPFELDEEQTLIGLDFESDGKKGWWATLVAIPRESAEPVLKAVAAMGWNLCSLSLSGTQIPSQGQTENTSEADIIFGLQRGTFTVFRNGRLQFHYDLGTLPEPPPLGAGSDQDRWNTQGFRAWLEVLGSLIAEPLDFCLNARPGVTPSKINLIGLPEQAAPLVTDWNERFGAQVAIVNPLREYQVSDDDAWLGVHGGMVVPATLAGAGHTGIDCTPAPIRRRRDLQSRTGIVRGVFVVSLVSALTVIGLFAGHLTFDKRAVNQAAAELTSIQNSGTVQHVRALMGLNGSLDRRFSQLQEPPELWMPWLKTVLGTCPSHAELTSIDVSLRSTGAAPGLQTVSLILHGSLAPDGPPHALTYRTWMSVLAKLNGSSGSPTLQERSLDWKGQIRSVFTIELTPELSVVTGGAR